MGMTSESVTRTHTHTFYTGTHSFIMNYETYFHQLFSGMDTNIFSKCANTLSHLLVNSHAQTQMTRHTHSDKVVTKSVQIMHIIQKIHYA